MVIPEKNFHLFHNKFRPVNCMCYIKCGVNILLHNYSFCRRSVAPRITVLSWHIRNEYDLQIYFCVKFLETRHHAQAHITSGALIQCALSLAPKKNTDGSTIGLTILLASACGGSRVAKHFSHPNLVFQPVWGWGDLGFFQLPQSYSSPEVAWNLIGYI